MVLKRCKNCLIPANYPNIKINDDRICNYCLEQNSKRKIYDDVQALKSKKIELKKDFENLLENCKGKSKYDCLLLFSGGKDSSYLLYLLTKKYGLNVMTVTIDTGLGSPLSKINAQKIIKLLNVDHIFYRPQDDFFKKLYRYLLVNPNKKTYCNRICSLCQRAMQSIGLKIATEKKIPFVAIAYSPNQVPLYEIPKEKIFQSWIPKELHNEPFNENDRSYYWDPKRVKAEDIPRFIIPFYVVEYPDVEKIKTKLSELGLSGKEKFNPIKTNCYLHWLLMYLDINKYGYNPYIELTCDLIRKGKTTRRKEWFVLTIGSWLFKSGIIKRRIIKHDLDYLNLNLKNLLNNNYY